MQITTQETLPVPGKKEYNGDTSFNLTEGQELKIKTIGNGDKILEMTVPEGKSWKVYISVHITET